MRQLVAALVVGVAVSACTGGGSDTADDSPSREDVVAAITTDVILPGYERLAAATDGLYAALGDLCRVSRRRSARGRPTGMAWRPTGMVRDAAVPVGAGHGSTGDVEDRLSDRCDEDHPVARRHRSARRDGGGFAGIGPGGLGGIEVALFGDDPTGARPCAYATLAAELVAATAATLAQEWAAGVDADAQQVVEELINGIVFTLGELADMRLGPASGSTTGAATPADVDAGPARSALDDMLAMLDGVDDAVRGLDPLISAQSDETADRLATQLGKAWTNIGSIPAPLATATDVEAMASAYRSTAAALTITRAEVASLLGVTLTLGDGDGDS